MRQNILLKTIMTLIQQYGEDCKLEALLEVKRTIPQPSKPTLVREEKPRRKYTKRNPPSDTERVPT